MSTTTLFRPVGLRELALVWESGMREFPPRLPHQPIFYPVVNLEYALQIARDWNTKDEASGFAGFVTRFEVQDSFISDFEPHVVGSAKHVEYWIPADKLPLFNKAIEGLIGIGSSFFGAKFSGYVPEGFNLKGKDAVQQFMFFIAARDYSMDFALEIAVNRKAVYLNSAFWEQHDFSEHGINKAERDSVLKKIRVTWRELHRIEVPLPFAILDTKMDNTSIE